MVFTVAQNGIQLEEILYKSTVIVNERISRRTLHIRIILDICLWNGSRLLRSIAFFQPNLPNKIQYL